MIRKDRGKGAEVHPILVAGTKFELKEENRYKHSDGIAKMEEMKGITGL